jgi:hypothetical protein
MLLLGLPTYLLLRERMTIDWQHALIAGFVIGAAPVGSCNGGRLAPLTPFSPPRLSRASAAPWAVRHSAP